MDIGWTTIALAALALAGLGLAAWFVFAFTILRHVKRTQDRILNDMNPRVDPAWKSSRTTRRNRKDTP